ncbi:MULTISPECIES: N-methyl-L-tryptophan oxidase [Bacillaceae]|uniref:Monomeric sarcosine oxidase n=1 Tax=Pseudobacillus wudalianchiensis TaxID=1743143 RepID=A0A1B9ADW6_9BACI|nr:MULTISPECIES: N-methyl-L-tryptophan oxidase [Bacillus]KMY53985.1 methyltryptophan oxidase [Bacillus sp. FJAT-27231]OCA82036.1 N-methyltryptophan oxidase [Bacillus wudalianchiensis]
MSTHFDVIVVGAGSMGMAAGYYLAKQGVKTLLVDSFDPPHTNGSHHGDTRIIRHAYGEGREYVPFALRAQELWYELENTTHHKIFTKTGVLVFGPKGESAFVAETIEAAKEHSLTVDLLEGEEINKRWPGVVVPENYNAIFEPNSGVLFSENCIRAYRELAEAHGAKVLTYTPVEDFEVSQDLVKIQTAKGSYTANKLIVSMGAWNSKLLSKLNINVPLQPYRQVVGFFESDESKYSNDIDFPAFMVEVPKGIYYGFPSFGGCGLKIGYHTYGQQIDPDTINREFGVYPEDENNLREFLKEYMPGANGELKRGAVCMYTKTPDEHFVIDLHPEYSNVAIAAGFSGHGFKFSSVVGETLSQLVTTGKTDHDISIFSLNRPALKGSVTTN